MWAEENPDKCWKPYTVLHEDEGMEIRFKEQGRRKQRILSQTRSIPRQSTRRYGRLFYQHAESMDASISFREEELDRFQEWINPRIRR